jgi:hypothetical protein
MKVQFLAVVRDFFILESVHASLVHPPVLPSGYTMDFYPGPKRLEHEADHLPPCGIKIMNEWNYISTTPMSSWHITHSLRELSPAQLAASQELPAFYGTQRFITVFTRSLHWSLS